MDKETFIRDGRDRLWNWFGLSYASWITLPRVMCHEMPDEWQLKMAELMEEWENTWVNMPKLGTRVQITENGKLTKTPKYLLNYRHPDKQIFEEMKKL